MIFYPICVLEGVARIPPAYTFSRIIYIQNVISSHFHLISFHNHDWRREKKYFSYMYKYALCFSSWIIKFSVFSYMYGSFLSFSVILHFVIFPLRSDLTTFLVRSQISRALNNKLRNFPGEFYILTSTLLQIKWNSPSRKKSNQNISAQTFHQKRENVHFPILLNWWIEKLFILMDSITLKLNCWWFFPARSSFITKPFFMLCSPYKSNRF